MALTAFGRSFWPFWNIVDGFDVVAINYPVQPHDYVVVLIHCITTDDKTIHQHTKLSQKMVLQCQFLYLLALFP
jgi:hypothetical protein